MSQSAAKTSTTTPTDLLAPNQFLLRRLHSLTGIIPVGAFLAFHLFTNSQMLLAYLGMHGAFQDEVGFIHSLPALLFIEIFGLWLPIAFHAGLGLIYTFGSRPNSLAYPYADNWRYLLQRITGVIALLFIFFHIATLRWRWSFGGMMDTPFYATGIQNQHLAFASSALAIQAYGGLVLLAYIVGVFSSVFHFANGLWTAAITWGLTISVASQRRWAYICTALGLALALFSASALTAGWLYHVTPEERQAIRAYHDLNKSHNVNLPTLEEPASAHPIAQPLGSN